MTEQRCPDCDASGSMGLIEGGWYGDGKCSHCHGEGYVKGFFDMLADEPQPCTYCNTSGICQTCGGKGAIDG